MLFSGFELEPGIPGNSNFGFVVSMLSKTREIERPNVHDAVFWRQEKI